MKLIRRCANFVFLLCFALSLHAGEPFVQKPLAEGIVSSVDPNMQYVILNGGLVIDISSAAVHDSYGNEASPANIRPGSHIATVLRPDAYAQGQALSAAIVQLLQQPIGTMTGKIEAVDPDSSSITILGQKIFILPDTHFRGSVPDHDPQSLAELKPGETVTVFLDGNLYQLRAQSIYDIPPTFADENVAFDAIITKIEGNVWSVRAVHLNDRTITQFNVTSGTSKADNFHPGDSIEVFARVDGDQVTAEAIQMGRLRCPNFNPIPLITLEGVISSISATSVTITDPQGNSYTIALDANTIYSVPDPVIGDAVQVMVEKHGDSYTGTQISLWDFPFTVDFTDTIKSIEGSIWTIGTHTVTINPRTQLVNNPQVGDRAHVEGINTSDAHPLAIRITKQ